MLLTSLKINNILNFNYKIINYNFKMSKYIRRLSKDVCQEQYKVQLRIISIFFPVKEDMFGIYFKVKRGHNRMIGKNRYAVYKDS